MPWTDVDERIIDTAEVDALPIWGDVDDFIWLDADDYCPEEEVPTLY